MTTRKWGLPEPPQFLELSEARAIIGWIAANSLHKYRDLLVLETLWQTGGRISEVLSMGPEGIGENSLIIVNLKQHKRQKDTILPHKEVIVSKELCQELAQFSNDKPGFIFKGNTNPDKMLNYRYVYRLITKAARELGIRKSKKRRMGPYSFTSAWPHLFRHGSAMRILDSTNDLKLVQRQMGHSSIVTTEMYAQVRSSRARKGLSEIDWEGKEEEGA